MEQTYTPSTSFRCKASSPRLHRNKLPGLSRSINKHLSKMKTVQQFRLLKLPLIVYSLFESLLIHTRTIKYTTYIIYNMMVQ